MDKSLVYIYKLQLNINKTFEIIEYYQNISKYIYLYE